MHNTLNRQVSGVKRDCCGHRRRRPGANRSAAGLKPPQIARILAARNGAAIMRKLALLFACAIALPGCAQIVSLQEGELAAAGFRAQPADTPERQALLADLPSQQFVRGANGDLITYTYADPLVCHCLYVGTDGAYASYRRLARERTSRGIGQGSAPIMNANPGNPAQMR
jgi:hypothetical protein